MVGTVLRSRTFYQLYSGIALLIVWEVGVSVFGLVSASLVPPPSEVALALVDLLGQQRVYDHAYITLRRSIIASVISATLALLLGIAMGWNRGFDAAFRPLLSAVYPLPVIALLPLVMLIFGVGDRSFIFVAGFGAFFLMLWNTINGVRSINEHYFDIAVDNDVDSTYLMYREVLIPGALPYIFTGLRLCLSTAFLVVVSVELIAADAGLGFAMWRSYSIFAMADMYAFIVIIAFVGALVTYGLEYLESFMIPWKAAIE